ncbi:hypothetical protein EDB86DRAFT_2939299 [Lactarius hatsudake]|nr:hypothetical protein EDB86DRAFT_2939299 [Lactarius hatsudake]
MSTTRGIESWQLDSISFEPKLDYGNYSLWSAKTELILQSRGLWGLVDGTEVAPEAGAEEAEPGRWKMRDASARLQLMTNIPDKWLWVIRRTLTSTFKKSLALRRFNSTRISEDGDVRAHVLRMVNLWQDVLDTGASALEDVDFFAYTLLDSLPPSWSVFVTAWKSVAEDSGASGSAIVGHILDQDAWNRGRAEAHKRRSSGQRKPRSSKIVED